MLKGLVGFAWHFESWVQECEQSGEWMMEQGKKEWGLGGRAGLQL
jgi:hypothetical protein